MQMVGATKAFIRKPFGCGVKLGMIGAISNFALLGVLIYVETSFPDLGILDNPVLTAVLY
jgi:cell division transport system permease protein